MAPSRHDWKIVDWDVKPQHKQNKIIIFLLKDPSHINITYNILCSLIHQNLLGPLGIIACFG